MIGCTLDEKKVFDREDGSHIHQSAASLVAEAISRISAAGRSFMVLGVEMGRTVGENICVETTSADEIIFAQRPGRQGLTRFVKNRQPESSSVFSLVLEECRGEYILLTIFISPPTPVEPWHHKADAEALAFWQSHAFIWGMERIIEGTETSVPQW